ncbi:MAG: flagellar protein FlaG [Deltaproteobacteria bacterium]|jgi:flagellar protein FlaG|nr:flagellar protein FlaG [Deltaproteobacteria bacterium]
MSIKPITGSVKSLSPPFQAKLTPGPDETQKNGQMNKSNKSASSSELEELLSDVQKHINIMNNVDLHFKVHEASGQIVVTVTDESTGEVIREIPSSEFLRFTDEFGEIVAMIFDQRV